MKKLMLLVLATAIGQSGCAFLGGAATGALGTGAAYEYNAKRQMDRLDDDLRAGKINRDEYNDRKRQVERGSLIY